MSRLSAAPSVISAAPLVPLRGCGLYAHNPPDNQHWVESLIWQPIARQELHLLAQYLPLAIRTVRDQLVLGVLLDRAYLLRPPVDAAGHWQAGVLPTAARSFPFQATGVSADPLDDLVVPSGSPMLSAQDGERLIDAGGQATPAVKALHGLCRQINASRKSLAPALDHLAIADLLAPLRPVAGRRQPVYQSVNAARFADLPERVLAAMARTSFSSLDIAVACLFSQRHLKPGLLEADRPSVLAALPMPGGASTSLGLFGPGSLVLDDGDLLSMDDLDAMHVLDEPDAEA